jgi:hypothetical protein
MQPLGGRCRIGQQLGQRSPVTSSKPVTPGWTVVILGLHRSNDITLSDGAARGKTHAVPPDSVAVGGFSVGRGGIAQRDDLFASPCYRHYRRCLTTRPSGRFARA